MLEETVLSPQARIQKFLDGAELKNIVARHDGGCDNQYAIWVLLALGVWLEENRQVELDLRWRCSCRDIWMNREMSAGIVAWR